MATTDSGWGRQFDPDRVALIELRAWKAYYRRQPLRLFALLVMANREQAHAAWPKALVAAFFLAKARWASAGRPRITIGSCPT